MDWFIISVICLTVSFSPSNFVNDNCDIKLHISEMRKNLFIHFSICCLLLFETEEIGQNLFFLFHK